MTRPSYHTRRSSNFQAFTLIELLVVIAIIATLAAILFPVFAQAKESAKKANCIANLKNIIIAGLMYAEDHDGIMCSTSCSVGFFPDQDLQRKWWGITRYVYSTNEWSLLDDGFLHPYLKNKKILDCPSAQDVPRSNPLLPISAPMPYAYGLNLPDIDMSDLQAPAETIYLADTAAAFAFSGQIDQYGRYEAIHLPGFGIGNIQGRHTNKQASLSWFDGHVSAKSTVPLKYVTGAFQGDVLYGKGIGAVLKYPWEDATPTSYTVRDHYYYTADKPVGF